MTIDQQVALDEALIPHASRLRIRKSNFHLRSDITYKESTLQLVYDVLRLTPFYKAFLVTADVPEIYMQEFWATATTFDELLFKEKILAFLRYLGHSGEIRKLTDVNINKLHQPWRSFAAVINKCLSGKSTGYDSLRLSQAQILWGMYHKKNIDFAYLMREDFVYQVEHKDAKKCNEMYYPRFTKFIIHFFMTKDPLIPRRNKSSSDTTMPPLTTTSIRLSTFAKGKQPVKSSKEKGLFVLSEVAMTEAEQMKLASKKACNKLISLKIVNLKSCDEDDDDEVDDKSDDQQDDDDQDDDDQDDNDDDQDTDNDDDDFIHPKLSIHKEEAKDEESFNPIVQTPKNSHDEAVKVAVQIQSNRLRDESQAKNEEFLNNLDENIQKIIKEQVKEQVKISYVVAVDLFEMELKKILIEKMESNKSIHQSDEQRNLYKALVDAYEFDKIILDTYGDTVTLKRHCDDADKDEEPSAGSEQGSKRRREGKEPMSTSAPKEKATKTTSKSTKGSKSHQKTASESAPAEELRQTTQYLEEPSHQEFKTCAADDQSIAEASQHPEWFQIQKKPPTPNRAWNKTLIANILTPEFLAGPTYKLMKGSRKSLMEIKLFLEEVYKATTDQLDWNNLEGQQYPHNLLKPLPLIPNSRGHCVIPFDHFINKDLEYLHGSASSRKYTTSVTKTKAAYYGHIKWIEDLARFGLFEDVITKTIAYYLFDVVVKFHRDDDKLYKFKEGDVKRLRIQDIKDILLLLVQGKLTNITVEERFAFNVSLSMFTRSIEQVKEQVKVQVSKILPKIKKTLNEQLKVEALTRASNSSNTSYVVAADLSELELKNILIEKMESNKFIHRSDQQKNLYKALEGDVKRLRIQDIKDILLLLVQGKLTNITVEERFAFNVSLSISDLKRKKAYTAYSNPRGFIYQNKYKQNRLMRIDELHKFNKDMLNDVRTALDDRLKGIQMKYLRQTIWRRSDKERAPETI
nr:hypothetical protein [Tanacetum cinerariifolium]